ncbi:MAG TPA: ABC transporter permease [Ktedonobacterales bacterium]|nr:ABC transporter permease [Ktedonobacterales bacterium]
MSLQTAPQSPLLAPPVVPAPQLSPAPAASGGWLLQTARLTGWMLFLARRRVIGKVLLGVLVGVFLLIVAITMIIYFETANAPVSSGGNCQTIVQPQGTPSSSTAPGGGASTTVVCQQPSQAELQQQQQAQQQAADAVRDATLVFPSDLVVAGTYTTYMGVFLICIIAGALVGGEYGYSVLRLSISRGVSRSQHFIAQSAALAILSLGVAAVMLLLGTLIGVTIGPALGGSLLAPSLRGVGELITYWLALGLNLFVYTLIAQCFATLGKSALAGIGVPLAYLLLEVVAGAIITAIGFILSAGNNPSGPFVQHIPDWFLGTNVGSLVKDAGQYPYNLAFGTAPVSTTHALLVTLAYCAALIAAGYLVFRSRDITD